MKSQYGFLLVTAIFLLVILAALGAFILTISGTQQTSSALDVQGSRAYQAARAGIEWASYQLLINPAAAFVQQKTNFNNSATTLSVTLTSAPANNNLLVMVGAIPSGPLTSVSGGGVTTWTKASSSGVWTNVEIWYGITNGSSGVVTISTTFGANNIWMHVSEWSGMATTGVLDQATASAGTSASSPASASAGSITTTNANDVLIFGISSYSAETFGTPTPGTWTAMTGVAASNNRQGEWYQVVSATGAYAPTVSITGPTTIRWDVAIAAFKSQVGGAFITACTPGPATQNVTGMGGTLSGFTAAVTCSSTTYTEGGATVTVYQITSTGAKGTVGTLDRVERQLQVTLTK